jgi:hypothetical protein
MSGGGVTLRPAGQQRYGAAAVVVAGRAFAVGALLQAAEAAEAPAAGDSSRVR